MISRELVRQVAEEWLEGKEYFLVDVDVKPGGSIVVEIDHADGVWIDDCVELSKYIEGRIDREEEDYELEVGSAGIGQPLKVERQYRNLVGKEVEVLDAGGRKTRGTLKSVDPDGAGFVVETMEKVRREGAKRPSVEAVEHAFRMDKVKYTKQLITFK